MDNSPIHGKKQYKSCMEEIFYLTMHSLVSESLINMLLFSNSNLHPTLSPSDVFEQPHHVGHKKIEFHITTDIPAVLQINSEKDEKNGKKIHTSNVFNIKFM